MPVYQPSKPRRHLAQAIGQSLLPALTVSTAKQGLIACPSYSMKLHHFFTALTDKPDLGKSRPCLSTMGAVLMLVSASIGQADVPNAPPSSPQLNVNWLYGAYVPKDAPLETLTRPQRFRLYVRQTFTTPGIYVKTLLFSVGDQLNDSPPGWGQGVSGYARRVGSRQAQFVIQNSLVSLGNGFLGYEPRYDRCQCAGFWSRTAHAVERNFVTYDRTEQALRPQIALYGGAFAAGTVAGTWKPTGHDWAAEGYQGVITQAGFGTAANWIAEFAPDIIRKLRGNKVQASPQ
jgi:hypothetical protein